MVHQIEAAAAELLRGALDVTTSKDGWSRPERLTAAQRRALGSVRAWHPGLFRQMAGCTAGVCLAFETDATRVSVEARVDELPRGSVSVLADVRRHPLSPEPPYDGLSATVDGRALACRVPDGRGLVSWELDDPACAPEPGLRRLPGMGEPHVVRVWLPCLTGCEVRTVSCDGTYLRPAPARRQLLVLGDSIAQGFVACGPGGSWPALLAESLGLDLVNQGIGGQVFQPGSLAGVEAVVDPEAVVVEFGENYRYERCGATMVERDVRTYLYEVCEAFPDAAVWALTRLPHSEDVYPTHERSCAAEVDGMIRAAAARLPRVRVVDGSALLDASRLPELLADGSDHPGPAGQRMVADRLAFVVGATREGPEGRRERALGIVEKYGEVAFPLAECLRRGAGEVLLADSGAVVVEVAGGVRLVAARNRRLAGRALECLGRGAGVTCVCGESALAREVARATGGRPRACALAVWPEGRPAPERDATRDLRTLTPAYAGAVRERYGHADHLAPGELEAALEAGAVIGGFSAGRLAGFVGEHPEGTIGMLEVVPEERRRGWGRALLGAQVARELSLGWRPWSEVWPENDASLCLHRALGFEVAEAGRFWVVS